MSKVFVALTCGVSILQNLIDIPEFVEVLKTRINTSQDSIRNIIRNCEAQKLLKSEALSKGKIYEKALEILSRDPIKLSAELNSLIKLFKKISSQNGVTLVKCQLLTSDTGSGYFCASLVKDYLLKHSRIENVEVSVDSIVSIRGLVGSPEDIAKALSILADRFARKLFQYAREGYDLYTVITGGFKIEASYITTIASIAKSKIVYCPDPSSDVLILPPLPVDIDHELLRILNGEDIEEEKLEQYIRLGLVDVVDGKPKLKPWLEMLISLRCRS